jgi:hypothetical protein
VTWDFHPIQDLIILERLDRAIEIARRRERHYCSKCGARTYYSVADTVYLHEGGSYFCPDQREESS